MRARVSSISYPMNGVEVQGALNALLVSLVRSLSVESKPIAQAWKELQCSSTYRPLLKVLPLYLRQPVFLSVGDAGSGIAPRLAELNPKSQALLLVFFWRYREHFESADLWQLCKDVAQVRSGHAAVQALAQSLLALSTTGIPGAADLQQKQVESNDTEENPSESLNEAGSREAEDGSQERQLLQDEATRGERDSREAPCISPSERDVQQAGGQGDSKRERLGRLLAWLGSCSTRPEGSGAIPDEIKQELTQLLSSHDPTDELEELKLHERGDTVLLALAEHACGLEATRSACTVFLDMVLRRRAAELRNMPSRSLIAATQMVCKRQRQLGLSQFLLPLVLDSPGPPQVQLFCQAVDCSWPEAGVLELFSRIAAGIAAGAASEPSLRHMTAQHVQVLRHLLSCTRGISGDATVNSFVEACHTAEPSLRTNIRFVKMIMDFQQSVSESNAAAFVPALKMLLQSTRTCLTKAAILRLQQITPPAS